MNEEIYESLKTPVRGSFDVIVCGGGIGGLSAAVSVRRMGARVLLLEKSALLGGLATIGLISWYEPICDGRGKKIMYGIADELLQLAVQYGPDSLPEEWQGNPDRVATDKRFSSYFSPSIFALALDQWLLDAGVEVLLDTLVVLPVMESNRCAGVVVENKSGRSFYRAKVVIDATGDADILFRSGVPCVEGKNYLTYIAYKTDMETCRKAIESNNILKSRQWINIGSDLWGKGHPEGKSLLTGVCAEEISQYILDGREMLFEKIRDDDTKTRDISILPAMAQFRTTRRISGAYELTEADMGKHFHDSVGVAADFANSGRVYELPYRILYNTGFENYLTAGRSVSSSGWAWDVTRVIPVAAATGQAAGVSAALCAMEGIAVKDVDIKMLQKKLVEGCVKITLTA